MNRISKPEEVSLTRLFLKREEISRFKLIYCLGYELPDPVRKELMFLVKQSLEYTIALETAAE